MTPEVYTAEAGFELNKRIGKAIGFVPEKLPIVSCDGGKSCRASVNRRDGPWYSEHELAEWLADEQKHSRHLDCVLMYWDRWPKFSTEADADFLALKHVRENLGPDVTCQVRDAIKQLWDSRAWAASHLQERVVYGCTMYEVGDWSRAACAVLEHPEDKS